MLRTLFFIEAYYQFKVVSEHIVGSSNNRADYLFRDQIGLFYTVGRIIFEDIKFRGYSKFHFK